MSVIKSPSLFFVTSPRTPFKMRREIDLLVNLFKGENWNKNVNLQEEFMRRLSELPDFKGGINHKNPALSARDRINRAPKSLGLVDLNCIALTPAGERFLDDDLADEALLRQLLKFQLPSPFHRRNNRIKKTFCVRPYLEILRLTHKLGRLAFDELQLFGMQLTDWHEFDSIADAIRQFRIEKGNNRGRYKKFITEIQHKVIRELFAQEIKQGRTRTREAKGANVDHFIKTKVGNFHDYADACLRYLRATGLITVSNPGRTISIIEKRRDEVEYILNSVDRNPVFIDDERAYCEYLFDADTPNLLTDDKEALERKAISFHAVESIAAIKSASPIFLKKKIKSAHEAQKKAIIDHIVTELKSFTQFDDVVNFYESIRSGDVYDPPLALEWNAWRTMTMMDGGSVSANLTFDDAGNPLSTAPGNCADIVCDYGDFIVIVEVTLTCGIRQYDAEGEPVARHLGNLKTQSNKNVYCIFVAPTICPSTISHFFMLHRTNVRYYGGKSVVIPLSIEQFISMLVQSRDSGYVPAPDKIRAFCEFSMTAANDAKDEVEWHDAISKRANDWLK